MKLSMWILADALKKYDPELSVTDGRRVLKSARICADEHKSSSTALFLSESADGRIIAANGHDIMLLKSDDIIQVLNDILEIFDFYNEWETCAEKAADADTAPDKLLSLLSEALKLGYILADASFYTYASSLEGDVFQSEKYVRIVENAGLLPLDVLSAINSQSKIRVKGAGAYIVNIPGSDHMYTAARNLFLGERHIGWLVALKPYEEFTRGEMELIDEFGEFCEKYHEKRKSSEGNLEKTAMFTDILDGRFVHMKSAERRLESFGWYAKDKKILYVLRYRYNNAAPRHLPGDRYETVQNSTFRLFYQDVLIVLVNFALVDFAAVEAELCDISEKSGLLIGKSPEFTNIFRLKEYFNTANICNRFAREPGKIYSFDDVAPVYCTSLIDDFATVPVKHPALSVLEKYDAAHKTELYETLKVFVFEERSFKKASDKLNIHRSTLIYRLDKINELTGIDLDNPDERFYILLSYRLR